MVRFPCDQCGWITVIETDFVSPIELDLVYRRLPPNIRRPDLDRTQDPKSISSHLRLIAGLLLDSIIERVQVDLPIARSALVSVMSRLENLFQQRISRSFDFDPDVESRFFPKIASLLWGVIAHSGGLSPSVVRNFRNKGVSRFLAWFEPIAFEIVTIATRATNIRRGELEPSFDGASFEFRKTARHAAVIESVINDKWLTRKVPLIDVDQYFSTEALEAQRLVLGFDVQQMYRHTRNSFELLKTRTNVEIERNICWIRIPQQDEELRTMILAYTLTLSRLCRFRDPFYFDLGRCAEPPMTPLDAILNATAANWRAYYPFCSMLERDGEPEYVLTSDGLMAMFLSLIETQKYRITDQLIRLANDSRKPELAKRVRLLVKKGSDAAEDAVCAVARSTGWSASGTRPSLPCGDIDAIVARTTSEGEVLVVLCEVKDADLPGFTPDAHESQSRDISKALGQLNKKAAWLAENWPRGFGASVFRELGRYAHGVIIKALVIKHRLPLELVNGAECVPLHNLKDFLSRLRTGLPPWFEGTRRASVVRF